ncbi:MAG: class I SAM-dependent methyltransferase [Chloroflexota bacterium]|nr:class I SAM-dependent methyltransferase [Chloroflexota bacterium]
MTARYGRVYAGVYNRKWTGFAARAAPHIYDYVARVAPTGALRTLLDVGCGTGQILRYFLDRGYHGIGLDLSPHMLQYAEENCAPHVEAGTVVFLEADARSFRLEGQADAAIATFDMVNHLSDLEELDQLASSVHRAVRPGGVFLFDLVTRQGMYRWNIVEVDDSEGSLIISRGVYDSSADHAHYRVTGFVERDDGLYERFDEVGQSTVFELASVRCTLESAGWTGISFARLEALDQPLDEPEAEKRVFVVANRV